MSAQGGNIVFYNIFFLSSQGNNKKKKKRETEREGKTGIAQDYFISLFLHFLKKNSPPQCQSFAKCLLKCSD